MPTGFMWLSYYNTRWEQLANRTKLLQVLHWQRGRLWLYEEGFHPDQSRIWISGRLGAIITSAPSQKLFIILHLNTVSAARRRLPGGQSAYGSCGAAALDPGHTSSLCTAPALHCTAAWPAQHTMTPGHERPTTACSTHNETWTQEAHYCLLNTQ